MISSDLHPRDRSCFGLRVPERWGLACAIGQPASRDNTLADRVQCGERTLAKGDILKSSSGPEPM